jgi:hypothetical protein
MIEQYYNIIEIPFYSLLHLIASYCTFRVNENGNYLTYMLLRAMQYTRVLGGSPYRATTGEDTTE